MAGSVSTSATSPRSSAVSTASQVVERHQHRVLGHVGGQAVFLRHERPVGPERHQRLIEVAVILPVEHQDLVAGGQDPRDADHLGVGLGRRQRVLPLREPVAAAELLGHDDRVLGGQEELIAARHALADGAHHRLGRVAAEHRHVGDVEVAVREAVDVGEPGARTRGDPQRHVVIRAAVPGHRHAVRHDVPGTRPQLGRAGSSLVEPRVLLVLELLDECAIDGRRRGHAEQSRGVARGRIELPTPRFSAACSTN